MSGPNLASLAWRNLWRQRRRTLLTLASIAFGGFMAVMMTAMQDQSFADFIDNAARLGAGHVTIQHEEYRDRPTLSRAVTGADEKRQLAEQDEEVVRVVERASGPAMLSTARDSFGGFFIAFDPQAETEETMEFAQNIIEGELFEAADSRGIVLGTVLADNLQAELGDKVVYTLTDRNGEIVNGMERLIGTVSTGATSTDAGLVLLPLDTVKDVVGYTDAETTQVAVFLGDGRQSIDVAERLDPKIDGDATVLTWDEVQPEIKAFVAMKVGSGRIMEGVIGLLVAAGIFNTIFMSVLERGREFGIMRAIGYSRGQLFQLVMFESAFLSIIGLLSCFVITAPVYMLIHDTGIDMTEVYAQQGGAMDIGGVSMDMVLRIGLYPESAAAIAIAIVGATMLAGIYPAWKAGRVDPVEAINQS
jgi:ABC-type lipoprotein release transport system permease subunit